jgi:hypothetical protein
MYGFRGHKANSALVLHREKQVLKILKPVNQRAVK